MKRERKKPEETFIERTRQELENEKITLGKQAYELGRIRGRKETIEKAKEWIQKNVPIIHTEEGDYVRVNIGHKNVPMNKYLADFETDMNKLWQDEK